MYVYNKKLLFAKHLQNLLPKQKGAKNSQNCMKKKCPLTKR
jgi:hypothetical protein